MQYPLSTLLLLSCIVLSLTLIFKFGRIQGRHSVIQQLKRSNGVVTIGGDKYLISSTGHPEQDCTETDTP